MKLWVDDVRPAPEGYVWVKSVERAIFEIAYFEMMKGLDDEIEVIDLDHDAGEYAKYGGDYIRLLDWLEEIRLNYPIHIHSMNPVGVQNMRAIIRRNNWKEI